MNSRFAIVKPIDVADAFKYFCKVYNNFRKYNGLDTEIKSSPNMFEFCTALMDKSGRIARQVKHKERNDPKDDWPNGLTGAMTGFIVYMLLMLDAYDVDITVGMVKELESSIKQYSIDNEYCKCKNNGSKCDCDCNERHSDRL